MTRDKYFEKAERLWALGKISDEVYDAMCMNADEFCDEEEWDEHLPESYAEIEYDDFEDPEAIMGARFDDMNYIRYREY